MKPRMILPLLPALAAMTCWYVPWIQSPLTAALPGPDPWGRLCMFLTGVQVCSVVASIVVWRSLRPWAWENAWEFLVLFQLCGNRRLDLYPLADIILLEDARLTVATLSIAFLAATEIFAGRRRLFSFPPTTTTTTTTGDITYKHNITSVSKRQRGGRSC